MIYLFTKEDISRQPYSAASWHHSYTGIEADKKDADILNVLNH